MKKHLCNSFSDQIFNNSAIFLDYYVEEDFRRNVMVTRGRIKVVKNT